jgi:hypothetical protein
MNPSTSTASPNVDWTDDGNKVRIIELVARNGWFPWMDGKDVKQNPDYSNLRQVSSDMKTSMDKPPCGGPAFRTIVNFLSMKNGFDDDEGFCDHCFLNEGEGCDTCDGDGCNYDCCSCTKAHRHGNTIRKLDPRLNLDVDFHKLSPREQAKLLVRFLIRVASNFHLHYYEQWRKERNSRHLRNLQVSPLDMPDLTLMDTNMWNASDDVFMNDFKRYNEPFYNFIHHLLFVGWAENDSYGSPGSSSPYRAEFLQDDRYNTGWNGGHREFFDDIFQCFMHLHKSDDTREVQTSKLGEPYQLSQIEYLPETIRRCVENVVDQKAIALLGKPIADAIDLYRLARQTYELRKEDLAQIQWMPCFGMTKEEYAPLQDFGGYNPQHERKNIDGTGLLWTTEDIQEEDW